jgi:hypothetical protein
MRLFRSWRYALGASVMVAVLLCLGIILSLPATGSEIPSALTMANVTPVHQEANGKGHRLDRTYLLAPAKEAEDADKNPVNADLLILLLLAASYFGASVRWLFTNGQRQGAFCCLGAVGESFATACEDSPFLGVFRL